MPRPGIKLLDAGRNFDRFMCRLDSGCFGFFAQQTATRDNLFLHLGNHQLQIEVVDVRTPQRLNPLKVLTKFIERRRLPRFDLNVPQLVERRECVSRTIHR